ncbi:MAG: hypothetical protein QXN05_05265 [Acidilobaceae archaeon]
MSAQLVERLAFILVEYLDAIENVRLGLAIARGTYKSETDHLTSGLKRLRELRQGLHESIDFLVQTVDIEAVDREDLVDIESLLSYYLIATYDTEREVLEEASDIIDTNWDLEELRILRSKIEVALERISELSKS